MTRIAIVFVTGDAFEAGGVSARHPELWDYYDCAAGRGGFQYRERTRKLRKVS